MELQLPNGTMMCVDDDDAGQCLAVNGVMVNVPELTSAMPARTAGAEHACAATTSPAGVPSGPAGSTLSPKALHER